MKTWAIQRVAEGGRMVVDYGRTLSISVPCRADRVGICLIQRGFAPAGRVLSDGIGLAHHNAVIQIEGGGS